MRAVAVLGALAVALAGSAAWACSCGRVRIDSPKAAYEAGDFIFEATVESMTQPGEAAAGKKKGKANEVTEREVKLKVTKVWKGKVGKADVVATAFTGEDCGYAFREGTAYLIFAHARSGKGPKMSVSKCGHTAELEYASVMKDLLVKGPKAK
jgi:hypothetical protein